MKVNREIGTKVLQRFSRLKVDLN
ncbi:hypothetical protein [Coxiella-like endosymbiont]